MRLTYRQARLVVLVFLVAVLTTLIVMKLPSYLAANTAHAEAQAQKDKATTIPTYLDAIAMTKATPEQIRAALRWRSALPSLREPGDDSVLLLSLNPARDKQPPMIWNHATQTLHVVQEPPVFTWPEKNSASSSRRKKTVVAATATELGAFSRGLAPAKLKVSLAEDPYPRDLWGYVDSEGRWQIPPRFFTATPFVGTVAAVNLEGYEQLINRKGETLQDSPMVDVRGMSQHTPPINQIGKWVWVRFSGKVPGSHSAGWDHVSFLTDGKVFHYLPGREANHSPDGALWVVETDEGSRLWTPERGLLPLPEGVTPYAALSATTFLGPSHVSQYNAIHDLSGKTLADPVHISWQRHAHPPVSALAPDRYIACDGYGDLRNEPRSWRDKLEQRCGIMDSQGRWWAKPAYHTILRKDDGHALLQTESRTCLADLRQPVGPDCQKTGSDMPLPTLQAEAPPPGYRQYGYQDKDGRLLVDYRLSRASAFTGKVAIASDGLPGLIDAKGQWLTPRPHGTPEEVALLRAWGYTSNGWGLIDRQGNWVIKPLHRNIHRYPDGSFCVEPMGEWPSGGCQRVDTTGSVLPPLNASEIQKAREAELAMPIPAPAPAPAPAPTEENTVPDERPLLEAVAIDGRWGFQNAEGEWVIPPQFDDAQDFSEGLGLAAVKLKNTGGDEAPENPPTKSKAEGEEESENPDSSTLAWGVINTDGKWLIPPRFSRIRPFREGISIAWESEQEGAMIGLLSTQGRWRPLMGISEITDFNEGVATATRSNGALCRLYPDGACQGAYNAIDIQRKDDRFAIARLGPQGPFGYLGPDDEWIVQPRFSNARFFEGDYAMASQKLPPMPASLRQQFIVTKVTALEGSGFIAISMIRPGQARHPNTPFALASTNGEWLVPATSLWSQLSSAFRHATNRLWAMIRSYQKQATAA